MTEVAHPQSISLRQDWMRAAIGLVVICGLTYLFTRLSLDNVAGATRRRNGTCCNTEFAHGEWWLPMIGLVVPIWWVTRTMVWASIPAFAIPTYATFYVADTTVNRYLDSGWGDGLESLAYVGSVIHGFFFAVAAAIGVLSWRRRRAKAERES